MILRTNKEEMKAKQKVVFAFCPFFIWLARINEQKVDATQRNPGDWRRTERTEEKKIPTTLLLIVHICFFIRFCVAVAVHSLLIKEVEIDERHKP